MEPVLPGDQVVFDVGFRVLLTDASAADDGPSSSTGAATPSSRRLVWMMSVLIAVFLLLVRLEDEIFVGVPGVLPARVFGRRRRGLADTR